MKSPNGSQLGNGYFNKRKNSFDEFASRKLLFENMLSSSNQKNHMDTENFFSEQKYDRFRGNLFQYKDIRNDTTSILSQMRTPEKLKFCKTWELASRPKASLFWFVETLNDCWIV